MPQFDMTERICRAMQKTWQAIGPECITEGGDLTKQEVIEAVCDSGYMEIYGQDKPAVLYFRNITYGSKEWLKITNKAFPFRKYGL